MNSMLAIKTPPQLAPRKGKPGEIEQMPLFVSTFTARDQAEIVHTASLGAYWSRENTVCRPTATALDDYRANQLACWIVESQFESGFLKYHVFGTDLNTEAIGARSKVHLVKLQISAIL